MPNLFSRLFQSGSPVLIEDLRSFVSCIGATWDPALEILAVESPGDELAGSSFEAHALVATYDAPFAIVAIHPAAAGSASSGGGETRPAPVDSLIPALRAALSLLEGGLETARTVDLPLSTLVPDLPDYLAFASRDGALLILLAARFERSFGALLASLGVKLLSRQVGEAVEVASPLPSDAESPLFLSLSNPWAASAVRFFFPPAFRAGETSLRFVPTAMGLSVPPKAVPDREAWFRFGVRGEGFQQGGVWIFRRPESLAADKFGALAASVSKAAAAALAVEYKLASFPVAVAAAVAATAPLNLGEKPLFCLEGFLTVGYTRIELGIHAPAAWMLSLAKALGVQTGKPVEAALILSRELAGKASPAVLDTLATVYQVEAAGATSQVPFIPFFEILGAVPEADYRKLVQNFLIRRYHRDELAELLFYRKTIQTPSGPKRVPVRPQCFDLNRFSATLPPAVSESFVAALREGASAPAAEDFLRRNEAVYEAAVADIRNGSLELSARSAILVNAVFTRYIYPRKRRRLDAMIARDYPFAAFRTLPPRIFRAVVDRTDYQSLAAAAVGHEEALGEIESWCSSRKLGNIRTELLRVKALLEKGAIDADEICTRRASMMERLSEVKEREQKERELEREREQRIQQRPMRAPERVRK